MCLEEPKLMILRACIASAIRIYYGVRLAATGDYTWYASLFAAIVPIEIGIGIITGCLPVLPKFFNHVSGQPLFSRFGSSINSLLRYSKRTRQQETDSGVTTDKVWKTTPESKRRWLKSYTPMPDSHELSLVASGGQEGRVPLKREEKEAQITRTVHIAMDSNTRDETPEEDLRQMSQNVEHPWDGHNSYRNK
jgi:hypothetical protein